jgi:hypothetical protein
MGTISLAAGHNATESARNKFWGGSNAWNVLTKRTDNEDANDL